MGRGSRSTTTAPHDSAAALRAARSAPGPTPQLMALRHATRLAADAVYDCHPDPDAHLSALDQQASQQVSGRGGRLITAVNDLIDAERLALSDQAADHQLARHVFDNAIWQAARLAGQHEPGGALHQGLTRAVDEHIANQAPATVDRLRAQGLLSDQQAAALAPDAAALARAAYTTPAGKPPWAAVRILDRAGAVRANLRAVDAPAGTPLAALRDRALADCDKQIVKAQQFLAGKDSLAYQITKDSAATLTRADAVAAALTHDQTRAVNDTLTGSFMDAHDQLVAEFAKPRSDQPVIAVDDARWLSQIMNYQAQISHSVTDADAVHSSGFAILLAPHVARDVQADAAAGRVNDAVLHEKVHTTQPRDAKGKLLNSDHHRMEMVLLEGGTQAKVNELAATLHTEPRHGLTAPVQPSGAYPAWTAIADAAAGLTDDPAQFRTTLNATPRNSRTALIARTFAGSDDEAAQRAVIRALLPVVAAAEQRFDMPSLGGWAHDQARGALQALQAASAAA